jgi:hypothetical protein
MHKGDWIETRGGIGLKRNQKRKKNGEDRGKNKAK